MCEIIRALCIPLQSAYTVDRSWFFFFAKGDISFVPVLHILCREPGRSSSLESDRPEANRGVKVLTHCMRMKVWACVWRTVFTSPQAVRGWCNCAPPSTRNNRVEVVYKIAEDHKVIWEHSHKVMVLLQITPIYRTELSFNPVFLCKLLQSSLKVAQFNWFLFNTVKESFKVYHRQNIL